MTPLKQLDSVVASEARPLSAPRRWQAADDPAMATCYRRLALEMRERLKGADATPRVIGVTSCSPGEGVSTVAFNLAVAAAQTFDRELVLVDSQTSRPSLAHTMEIARSPGVGDYLAHTASLSDCLRPTWLARLKLLPSGAANHADWSRVPTLLEELRRDFAWVVVDLPPIAESEVWLPLAGHLDGVLLVVAAEHLSAAQARGAADHLRNAGAALLGAVFNGYERYVPEWLERQL